MYTSILLISALAGICFAGEYEPCFPDGYDGPRGKFIHQPWSYQKLTKRTGVCVPTSDCSDSGGTPIDGACPFDADDIKCCYKTTCSLGGGCLWQSDCAGSTAAGECPGLEADQFMCCSESTPDYTVDDSGNELNTDGCQDVAVAGAEMLVAAWPDRVRVQTCLNSCDDDDTSDHCDGMAVDFLTSDSDAVSSASQFRWAALKFCRITRWAASILLSGLSPTKVI